MRILILLFLSFFLWNLSYADEIPRFSFYKPLKETELQQFLMSEKFDGVRGIWNGKSLQTRKENVIVAPKFWFQNFPPFILDGELWLRHNAFEETLSIVSSAIPKEEQWREVVFQVFDVRGVCEDCTLRERLEILQEYLPKQLTNDEINAIIEKACEPFLAEGMKAMGKVIKSIMDQYKGQVDGKFVSEAVKARLQKG